MLLVCLLSATDLCVIVLRVSSCCVCLCVARVAMLCVSSWLCGGSSPRDLWRAAPAGAGGGAGPGGGVLVSGQRAPGAPGGVEPGRRVRIQIGPVHLCT